jgi:hypothetical protein
MQRELQGALTQQRVFGICGATGTGKLTALKNVSSKPINVIDLENDFAWVDVVAWCKRNLDGRLGGDFLNVLCPAELLDERAVRTIADFVHRNNCRQVVLLSTRKIPVLPVVYMRPPATETQEMCAVRLGCPQSLAGNFVRLCKGDLRQLTLMATAAAQDHSLANVDPRYHIHFNVDNLLHGKFQDVPDDSFNLSHVHLNILQPASNGGTVALEGAANFAADLTLLDTMPVDCGDLGLMPSVVKSSLLANALLGKRVHIETSMPKINVKHSKTAASSAMMPWADLKIDGIKVKSDVMERIQVTTPSSSLRFQIAPYCPEFAQQQQQLATSASGSSSAAVASDLDDYTEKDMIRFIKLRIAHFHEGSRMDKSKVVYWYKFAINNLKTVDVPPEDSWGGWWFRTGVQCLEWLLDAFEPLRLARLDLYKYWELGDVDANVEVVHKIANDHYSVFLMAAIPPWDVSHLYEEPLTENFEPRVQVFDFEAMVDEVSSPLGH